MNKPVQEININKLDLSKPQDRTRLIKYGAHNLPPEIQIKLRDKLLAVKDSEEGKNRIAYFKPYPWQERFLKLCHEKKTVAVLAPNKIGKSCISVCTGISWCLGYEPWNRVDKNFSGAVRVKRGRNYEYYSPSSLGIKPPVNIVICGEDWTEHIGKMLVPEFKLWAPAGSYEVPRKNEQGIESYWKWNNKSTLTFRCYTQEARTFESNRIQGAITDELLPQDIREALKRALYMDGGKMIINLTPLDMPWILDEIVLKKDPSTGIIDGLTILDNPDKYDKEKRTLKKMGLSDSQILTYFDLLIYHDKDKGICVRDQGKKADGFLREIVPVDMQNEIMELNMLDFVKSTKPENAPTRFFGAFKELVGKVIKNFNEDKHVMEARPVMSHWMVVPFIDWHPGTEIAVSAYAVTEHDMTYVVDEIWRNMTPEECAEILIGWKEKLKWRIREVFIDPLAKGDTGYVKNRMGDVMDSFHIIEKKIRPYKMRLLSASKDEPSGIANIESMLDGPNGIPLLYFYDSLPSASGAYGHLFEIDRWTRDKNGKPKGEYGHFMENLYRKTLDGIKWRPPKPQNQSIPNRARQPVCAETGW